jgi:hypothetical protein
MPLLTAIQMSQQKMSLNLGGFSGMKLWPSVGLASYINNPGPPLEVISTQLLQSGAAEREAERERQHKNGNVPPQEGKAGWKNLDQTCLQLDIEWPETTSGGRARVHYFCIACDKFRANNARSRAFEHADQCNVSMEFNIMDLIYHLNRNLNKSGQL